jgi:hypothetical protein
MIEEDVWAHQDVFLDHKNIVCVECFAALANYVEYIPAPGSRLNMLGLEVELRPRWREVGKYVDKFIF